jgi:hypothetical protein
MTGTDSTRPWWVGFVVGAILLPVVYSCTSDDRLAPPSPSVALLAAGQTAGTFPGTSQVPVPKFNDVGIAPVMTGIVIPPGVDARVTVTGFLTYTVNGAAVVLCPPPLPAPISPGNLTMVGPAGFVPVQDPRFFGGYQGGEVQVYESTDNDPPPNGIKLQFHPQDPSAGTVTATVRGLPPLGRLWVVRPPSFPASCAVNAGTPGGFSVHGYFVSGSQTLSADFAGKKLQVTIAVTPQAIAPPLNPSCRGTPGTARVSVNASWSDGSSAQGLAATLRAQFEGGSGGHAHQAGDRDGFGHFGQASGQLDASGAFMTDYQAGEVGGTERLIAVVTGDGQTATANNEEQIRVPGLIELGEGPTFLLVGRTDAHPRNHFATGFTIGNLSILADTFFAAHQKKLEYNDISLDPGGLFDLDAMFTSDSGHQGHRCGRETDVRTRSLSPPELDDVRNLVTLWLHGSVYDETLTSSPHYHIAFAR